MAKLLDFLFLSQRFIGWSLRYTLVLPGAVPFTEFTMFLEFGADMLRNAPNTAFTNDANIDVIVSVVQS